jgi:O-succinylbenzoic acid--CoA ligase
MAPFDIWPWQHWANVRSQSSAVIVGNEVINWHRLAEDIDQQAAMFYQQGVTENVTLALRGKNSYGYVIRYLAGIQLGARVLPINPQMPFGLLKSLFQRLSVRFFWDDAGDSIPLDLDAQQLNERVEINRPDHRNRVDWQPSRPATMTLTSGSSGMPKGVVHSAAAHLENADGLLQRMTFEAGDSWLLSLPMFHVSGQSIIWRWLLKGATLIVRDMRRLAEALSGCTHASLVPTQLWRLLSQPEFQSSLKQVLLGGAMISTELTQQAQAKGIHCWCGYGLTEMAATVCAKQADGLPGVGLPLPNRQMKLQNDQIYLRGAGLALGYWQDGALIPIVDEQGWFATRDKGRMENGELRILGRLDNEFFSGGEGIQPEDIERVLASHPLIEQAFILPIDDAEFGQRPVAIIQTSQELTLEQLLSWLDGKIARFQWPVACYSLPESLRQGGIKISRKALSDWLGQQMDVAQK